MRAGYPNRKCAASGVTTPQMKSWFKGPWLTAPTRPKFAAPVAQVHSFLCAEGRKADVERALNEEAGEKFSIGSLRKKD